MRGIFSGGTGERAAGSLGRRWAQKTAAQGFAALFALAALPGVSHAQDIPDLNGDGQINYAEFALALKDSLEGEVVEDRNGDGLITPEEFQISVVEWFEALQGDLNHDGVVDAADAAIVLDNMGTSDSTFDGDVTLDGEIDPEDLAAVVDSLGDSTLDADERQLVETIARALFFAASLGSRPGDPPHSDLFSSTWAPGHDQDSSEEDWAPNHDGGISGAWEPFPGDHSSDDSADWPANHLPVHSATWIPVVDPDHDTETSGRTWPPNHREFASWSWPDAHRQGQSRSWPPNHSGDRSNAGNPSLHVINITAGWGHGESDSSADDWPPNHVSGASGTWDPLGPGPGHDTSASQQWPAGHGRYASSSWEDTDRDPSGWPENHFADYSENWPSIPDDADEDDFPFDLPPFWPDGHSLVETGMDIVPLPLPIFSQGEPSEE